MSPAARSIFTLLVGAAILMMGNGLLVTLLPVRATLEGFSTTQVGAMGTAFALGFAVGCLLGPLLLKQVGHIRAFAGFAALWAVSCLTFDMLPFAAAWMLLRGLNGLFAAVLVMVIESWLNDKSSNKVRGRVLSLYIIVVNIVTMAGTLMLNLAPVEGHLLFTAAAIMGALSLVPLSLTDTASPRRIESAKLDIVRLFHLSPSGFIGCFIVGAVEGAFWTLGPVFAQERGMSLIEVTLFMAAFIAGGTLSQWPLGRWSDKTDRRLVISVACVGTVATGLTLALVQLEGWYLWLALAVLHGAFMFPIYALCLAHANDYAATSDLVATSGGLLLIYSAGAVVGPLIAGPAMDQGGEGLLFVFIALFLGLMALGCLLRKVIRPDLGKERLPFVPVPKTTPELFGLEEDWPEENGDGSSGADR